MCVTMIECMRIQVHNTPIISEHTCVMYMHVHVQAGAFKCFFFLTEYQLR